MRGAAPMAPVQGALPPPRDARPPRDIFVKEKRGRAMEIADPAERCDRERS